MTLRSVSYTHLGKERRGDSVPPDRNAQGLGNGFQIVLVQHFQRAGPAPVSYTHLDVYKRQAVVVLDKSMRAALGLKFILAKSFHKETAFVAVDSRDHQHWTVRAVSYTHLAALDLRY